jgi:hypothetical protein
MQQNVSQYDINGQSISMNQNNNSINNFAKPFSGDLTLENDVDDFEEEFDYENPQNSQQRSQTYPPRMNTTDTSYSHHVYAPTSTETASITTNCNGNSKKIDAKVGHK